MNTIIIAPIGDNLSALFAGLDEFRPARMILLAPTHRMKDAQTAKTQLETLHVPAQIVEVKGNIWESMFVKIAEIKEFEKDNTLLINTATGDRTSMCAATSAAFVNGLKAYSVDNNQPMLLPILKFSYYKVLTTKKMNILRTLNEPGCCATLEELAKKTKMSLPLTSYHVNGNFKTEGLKELGLVETHTSRKKTSVQITLLGRLLLKGYITA